MDASPLNLPSHQLKIALIHPQIAPNTGNIGRLCVATGTPLHLVRPLGFILSDKQLRRSAMDYWLRLNVTVHDDLPSFLEAMGSDRFWLLSSKGERSLWEADFQDGDWLIFGNEGSGLPSEMSSAYGDRMIRIPQAAGERCLNLATSAGIALYHALRGIV